jgi:hypothetical protein
MTIRMKSLKSHVYAGRRLKAGQEFNARSENDKRVLAAIKTAVAVAAPVLAPPVPAPRAVSAGRGRAMKAEPSADALAPSPAEPADTAPPAPAEAPAEAPPRPPDDATAESPRAPAKSHYRRRNLTAE